MNKVVSPYSAIVNGRESALAGCKSAHCKRDCLRKNPMLVSRAVFNVDTCTYFIHAVNVG